MVLQLEILPAGAAAYLTTTNDGVPIHIKCALGYVTNNPVELFAIWLGCKLKYQLLQQPMIVIIHFCTESLYVLQILSQNQPVSRKIRQINWIRNELNKWTFAISTFFGI